MDLRNNNRSSCARFMHLITDGRCKYKSFITTMFVQLVQLLFFYGSCPPGTFCNLMNDILYGIHVGTISVYYQ